MRAFEPHLGAFCASFYYPQISKKTLKIFLEVNNSKQYDSDRFKYDVALKEILDAFLSKRQIRLQNFEISFC